MSTDDARVRIQVVAEETGVPEATLRAWERRYGIPTPDRTVSGYRLYSRHEIDQVHRMRALCDSGVATAESARQVMLAKPATAGRDPLVQAREALIEAVARFDIEALETRIRQLLWSGDPLQLLEHVIEPTFAEVGHRWQKGEMTVAQEHFASQRIGVLLRDLLRLVPIETTAPGVLLGSFADDDHELGLYSLAIRLAHWGWKPLILGARLPASSLQAAVASTRARAVGLSLTIPPPLARARELLDAYGAALAHIPWIVGGSGVASLGEKAIRAAGGIVAPDEPGKLRTLFDSLRSKTK